MVTRGCCLPVGSCAIVVSLCGSSSSPPPPCSGWDHGWVWTHTQPWSCCAWQGRRWASPPLCWRPSETAWCSFAFGSCTCLSTRWVCTCLSHMTVLASLLWLADCHFRWGRSFYTSSGECLESNCFSVSLCIPLKMSFPVVLFQGQPSSGDRLPLYPRCSPDINQRVTRSQRAWSCHLLVGSLAVVQADVCLRCGQTHVSLSDVVGPHRCASLLFLFW